MSMLKTFTICCSLLLAAPVWAGGMSIHMFQSEKAFEQVRTPELRALLEANKNAWFSGTQYPDAGYVPGQFGQDKHVWGEASHWAPFILAYLEAVKSRCQGRYLSDPACGQLTAHLLGSAAHGLQDQVFDSLFIPKVVEVDHRGQETTDIGIDMILLREHNRKIAIPKPWYTPDDVLVDVYHSMGMTEEEANSKQIRVATQLSELANLGERVIAPFAYWHYKHLMPWGSRNYMRHPGGVEFGGKVTASFWEHLWQRLNDQPLAEATITHIPAAGQRDVAIDKRNTDSQISVTFDRYIIPGSVNAQTFRVTDPQGNVIPGSFSLFANPAQTHAEAHMIIFRPNQALLHDTTYTVRLDAGVLDDAGQSVFGLGGYQWQFHTEAQYDYVTLQSQGLCLGLYHHDRHEADSLPLQLQNCRFARHQHWFTDATGQIRNREQPALCLQPAGQGQRAGERLQVAVCGTAEGAWQLDGGQLRWLGAAQDYVAGTFLSAWAGIQPTLLPLDNDVRRQWVSEPVALYTRCGSAGIYSNCW